MEAEAAQRAAGAASVNLGVARPIVVRDASAMQLQVSRSVGDAHRPTFGSPTVHYEAVIPDLDAEDPRPVGHLLCNRHDPTQILRRIPIIRRGRPGAELCRPEFDA